MGTTDVSLGLRLLDCLDRLDVDYAVLHNADALVAGSQTSDIDLVVAGDPWEVIARLVDERSSHGLVLAMLWEYDRCSLTSFWISGSCDDGIQLDLLADPRGRGRYGLLTVAALADKVGGREGRPQLSATAEAAYTLSKRIVKRDHQRALAALVALETVEGANAEPALRRLLSPRMRRRAVRVHQTRKVGHRGAWWDRWRPRLSLFGLLRLATATGAIVSIPGDRAQVQRIADRISLVLPAVEVRTSGPSRVNAWWLTRGPRLVLVATGDEGSDQTSVGIARAIAEELFAKAYRRLSDRVSSEDGDAR